MRVPGIQRIACAPASGLPESVEMSAAVGIAPDLTGMEFNPVSFIGEPVCEVETSNENNGSSTSVTLTFITGRRLDYHRHVWLVWLQGGGKFLIGSKNDIPSFICKDSAAGAAADNHAEVTIKLDSFCAWVEVEGIPEGGEDAYIEISEAAIRSMINALN